MEASNQNEWSEEHVKLIEAYLNPEVQKCIKIIEDVIGFKPTTNSRAIFLKVHSFLTNPQPNLISEWRISEEQRYHKFCNGILGHVQHAFSCVEYYLQRVIDLESEVMERISGRDFERIFKNVGMGMGNALKLDFEYQSFVLAYRRCLDYLVSSINTFFKIRDRDLFTNLKKTLVRAEPQTVAGELLKVYNQHLPHFSFVVSNNGRSTRARIAHTEFVAAGFVNLNRRGLSLAGGGEDISLPPKTLKEILSERKMHLECFLREFLETFESSVKAHENQD